MADQLIARRWLVDLGRLTAARSSHDEAADFIDTCTPMIAMRFPNEAFTSASLEAVAAECKYLPTYGELVPLLGSWWRDHRPRLTALPASPIRQRDEPTPEEREHVAQLTRETVAALRSSEQPPENQRRFGANCLSREQLAVAYQREGLRNPRHAAP